MIVLTSYVMQSGSHPKPTFSIILIRLRSWDRGDTVACQHLAFISPILVEMYDCGVESKGSIFG